MANSVDPDQTAPIGAVCSGSTLFASILNSSVMLGNYLQQTTSADDIFKSIFFLGALRVKLVIVNCEIFDVKHSNINKMRNKQKLLYGLCVCKGGGNPRAVVSGLSPVQMHKPYNDYIAPTCIVVHCGIFDITKGCNHVNIIFDPMHEISNNVAF